MGNLTEELATNIHRDLVDEMLSDYQELKQRFRLNDLDAAIQAAGRFCEDTLKCVVYLRNQKITDRMGLAFGVTYDLIMNKYPKPTSTIDEYKFRLIPEVANAVYKIRSKKRGLHSRGETLQSIDLGFVVHACDWILASFLYVSHGVPEDEAISMMQAVVQYDTPLVQQIGGYAVLTRTDFEISDALLVVLYSLGGEAKQSVVAKNLKLKYSLYYVYKEIQAAHEKGLIFKHPDTNVLTLLPAGKKVADKTMTRLSI